MSYEYYQKNLGGLSVYVRQALETLIGKSDGTLFALSKNLKELNGQSIQSLLSVESIAEWMKLFCEGNAGFVFDGQSLRATDETLNATAVYDAGKVLMIEELLKMTDLEYLFSINAYDFPYCNSTEKRGVYEDFFDFLLKKVIPKSPQYHLLVESIPVLRVIVQEWFGILNCVAQIFQNINIRYKAYETIKASLEWKDSPRRDDRTIDDITRWFDRVELLRKKEINPKDEITISEPPPELASFLASTTAFKAMIMTKLISTEGKKEDKKTGDAENVYSAKIEYYHHTLFSRIAGETGAADIPLPPIAVMVAQSSKELFEKCKDEPLATPQAKEFCEQSLLFLGKFEDLIAQLNNPEGFYLLALDEGRKLMEEATKADIAFATRFRSSPMPSPRPGSGDSTPRSNSRSSTPRASTPKTPRDQSRADLGSSSEGVIAAQPSLGYAVAPMRRKSAKNDGGDAGKLLARKSGTFFLNLGEVGGGNKTPSPTSSPATTQRTPRTPRPGGSQSPIKK